MLRDSEPRDIDFPSPLDGHPPVPLPVARRNWLEQCMATHRRLVEQVIRRHGIAGQDIDEVNQRVFIALWECPKLREAMPENLGPWLSLVASRESITFLKLEGRRRRHERSAWKADDAVDSPNRKALRIAQYAAIESLQLELKEIIEDCRQGRHILEIAARLGLEKSAAYGRRRRAFQAVRLLVQYD